jgi:hypothetical protein
MPHRRREWLMASIEKRTRNGRLRYYVRYRDPSGRQTVKVFDRKVDADRYLISVENAKSPAATSTHAERH